VSFVI